jgi:hypothetical protein
MESGADALQEAFRLEAAAPIAGVAAFWPQRFDRERRFRS